MTKRVYRFQQQVNFPDIDLGGSLYHGRYFDYYDRARQQVLKEHGNTFGDILKQGVGLVAAEANIKYLRPVVMEDMIYIYTRILDNTTKSVTIDQCMTTRPYNDEELAGHFESVRPWTNRLEVKIVCVDLKTLRSADFPPFLAEIFVPTTGLQA